MTLRWTEDDLSSHYTRMARQVIAHMPVFPLLLHMNLPSLANVRLHYMQRARIAKAHRKIVRAALAGRSLPELPRMVVLTRIGPRKMDSDNLAISFKHVRDEIAAQYGVDDGSELYDWVYAQESRGKGVYAVRIEVKP